MCIATWVLVSGALGCVWGFATDFGVTYVYGGLFIAIDLEVRLALGFVWCCFWLCLW